MSWRELGVQVTKHTENLTPIGDSLGSTANTAHQSDQSRKSLDPGDPRLGASAQDDKLYIKVREVSGGRSIAQIVVTRSLAMHSSH